MNCRLPQTPRSPAAAASHYFDDVFTRQRRASLSGTRRNSLARSLTRTRSIGQRSDWTNGGAATPKTEEYDADANDAGDEAGAIYKEDPAEAKADKDDPINKYVLDRLQKLKANESSEMSEEIAASGDGADEKRDF